MPLRIVRRISVSSAQFVFQHKNHVMRQKPRCAETGPQPIDDCLNWSTRSWESKAWHWRFLFWSMVVMEALTLALWACCRKWEW